MLPSPHAVCPVCGDLPSSFASGPGGRPNAICAACGSLERHRFMALLLGSVTPSSARDSMVLDVAPSRQMSPLIRSLNPTGYLSIDFDPDADGRLVDLTASLTDLPFPDQSVGLLVCYHVLEHIPEDRLAMSEIARVLRKDGLAVVQVPWRRDSLTEEDPDATPEERLRRFGQADHVRWYGSDFVTRMRDAGLSVLEVQPSDVVEPSLLAATGLVPDETVWLCTVDDSVLPSLDDVRAGLSAWTAQAISRGVRPADKPSEGAVAALVAQTEAARAEATRWKAESARWRKRYESLRSRPSVRLMAALSRPFR